MGSQGTGQLGRYRPYVNHHRCATFDLVNDRLGDQSPLGLGKQQPLTGAATDVKGRPTRRQLEFDYVADDGRVYSALLIKGCQHCWDDTGKL